MRKTGAMIVLAGALALAPAAFADSTHTTTSGGDVNVTATGGAGGAGGRADADATGIGFGGSASNRNDVDTSVKTDVDVRNSANSGSFSGASSNQKQGQEQGISAFNGNTTTVEAPDVKGMGKELAKHASSAAEVRSGSAPDMSPCGDSTGLSAQAGVLGGGFATVSETCRAFRLQVLEARTITKVEGKKDEVPVATRLAEVSYYVGWLPRLALHLASFGVLN